MSTLHGGSYLEPTEQSAIDVDGHVAKKMKSNKNKNQYRDLKMTKVDSEEEEEVFLVGGGVVMEKSGVEAADDVEIVFPKHLKQYNSGGFQSQQSPTPTEIQAVLSRSASSSHELPR